MIRISASLFERQGSSPQDCIEDKKTEGREGPVVSSNYAAVVYTLEEASITVPQHGMQHMPHWHNCISTIKLDRVSA